MRAWRALGAIVAAVFAASFAARAWIVRSGEEARPPAQAASADCRRMVSLAPSVTETLYALGLGDRVVGVTRYCKYPPEAQEKTQVGGYFDPSLETIVTLRPDLVVMLVEHEESIPGLRELDFNRLVVNHKSIQGILDSIRRIGGHLGKRTEAEQIVADIEARMKGVAERCAGLPRPRAMICVDRARGSGEIESCYVAGCDEFLHPLLVMAGGHNVFGDEPVPFPVVGAEGIVRADPEVIVELAAGQDDRKEAILADWRSLGELSAVKNGRVHVVTENHSPVPGPRFVLLLEKLAELLHPATKPASTDVEQSAFLVQGSRVADPLRGW